MGVQIGQIHYLELARRPPKCPEKICPWIECMSWWYFKHILDFVLEKLVRTEAEFNFQV